MAKKPEQTMLDKLPKWAQQYITDIERERETAVRQLNLYLNEQSKSSVWTDDLVCIGEQSGPSHRRRYVQARSLTFKVGETEVYVGIDLHDSKQLKINCGGNQMVFHPTASNAITIIDQ